MLLGFLLAIPNRLAPANNNPVKAAVFFVISFNWILQTVVDCKYYRTTSQSYKLNADFQNGTSVKCNAHMQSIGRDNRIFKFNFIFYGK